MTNLIEKTGSEFWQIGFGQEESQEKVVTLLYAAKDEEHNNALP